MIIIEGFKYEKIVLVGGILTQISWLDGIFFFELVDEIDNLAVMEMYQVVVKQQVPLWRDC